MRILDGSDVTLRWIIASLHLIALAIGLGAIYTRARLFRRLDSADQLPSLFLADNLWGLAAVLWLVTGLLRAFAGLEKGSEYYLGHPLFWAKMGCFLAVVLLELRPMVTLVRWRLKRRRGEPVDLVPARGLSRISYAEAAIVFVMVFLATAIARGLFQSAG